MTSSKDLIFARGARLLPPKQTTLSFHMKSKRQQEAEEINMRKWVDKWGRLPIEDEDTFVVPIEGTEVPTRIEWKSYE